MILQTKALTLASGKTCVLRSAEPEDAARVIDYMKIMLGETPYLLRTPEEFDYTAEQEAEILKNKSNDPRSLMILAEVDGEIVGTSDIHPAGSRSRIKHRCGLGMSVRMDFWRLGIGSVMMEKLIAFAEKAGYEQIELEVVSSNRRAVNLYLKYGFMVYGTRPHGLRYADGTYANDYLMYRTLP